MGFPKAAGFRPDYALRFSAMEAQKALLAKVIDGCAQVLHEATKQHEATFGEITDEERWGYLFPLRFEIQVRALFQQGLDALRSLLHRLKVPSLGRGLRNDSILGRGLGASEMANRGGGR
jgi:hypothetical protein